MTTTEPKTIGGWAEVALGQQNQTDIADGRKRYLLERLGQHFLCALNPSHSPEKAKVVMESAKLFAKECQRVFDLDASHGAIWEMQYLDAADKAGVDLDHVDEMAVNTSARLKLLTDPDFAKKVSDYAIEELHK